MRVWWLTALLLAGCGGAPVREPAPWRGQPVAVAVQGAPAPVAAEQAPVPTCWANRVGRETAAQFESACHAGSGYACRELAGLARDGLGVDMDPERAAALFERGCELGNAPSCLERGMSLRHAELGASDVTAAQARFERGCAGGSAEACYELATLQWPSGASVAALLERACDGGAANACGLLGLMSQSGEGAPRDSLRARALFERGCTIDADFGGCESWAGYVGSGPRSGITVGCGVGYGCPPGCGASCERTLQRARQRLVGPLVRACAAGRMVGCLAHALVLSYGAHLQHVGPMVENDDPAAPRALLSRACEGGVNVACEHLASQLGTDALLADDTQGQQAEEAAQRAGAIASMAHYRRGCTGGAVLACVELGKIYEQGQGVPADPGRAVALYERACELGSSITCGDLRSMYETGDGVPVHQDRARYFGALVDELSPSRSKEKRAAKR